MIFTFFPLTLKTFSLAPKSVLGSSQAYCACQKMCGRGVCGPPFKLTQATLCGVALEATWWGEGGGGRWVSHGICQTPPGSHHPRNDSLPGNISTLQLCSQRRERPNCPLGLRPGQFCAQRETVGKSSLPQVQPQPCPFPKSQGAEIRVLPSALHPHPGRSWGPTGDL